MANDQIKYQDKIWLYEHYTTKGMTTTEIADLLGCQACTVWSWLKKFGIETRKRGHRSKGDLSLLDDRCWLKKQHHEKKLTVSEIARKIKCSRSVVRRRLRKYKIPIRNSILPKDPRPDELKKIISEKMKKAWARGDFDGVHKSPTKIELETASALDILGIKHETQFRPEKCRWIYDEFVPPDVLIEVNGNFWHSSQKAKNRDAQKAKWAEENGFKLITLWENEIKEIGAWSLVIQRVVPLVERGNA